MTIKNDTFSTKTEQISCLTAVVDSVRCGPTTHAFKAPMKGDPIRAYVGLFGRGWIGANRIHDKLGRVSANAECTRLRGPASQRVANPMSPHQPPYPYSSAIVRIPFRAKADQHRSDLPDTHASGINRVHVRLFGICGARLISPTPHTKPLSLRCCRPRAPTSSQGEAMRAQGRSPTPPRQPDAQTELRLSKLLVSSSGGLPRPPCRAGHRGSSHGAARG